MLLIQRFFIRFMLVLILWKITEATSKRYANYAELNLLNINTELIETKRFVRDTKQYLAQPGICRVQVLASQLGKVTNSKSNSTTIEICCHGFKPYKFNNSICVPECEDHCPNGFCEAPNTCKCLPTYIENYNGDCVSTCPIGCQNGRCDADGNCTCNHRFELHSSKKFCVPICPTRCPNTMHCSPNLECTCPKHYELNPQGICEPDCRPNCMNGKCIDGRYCTCNPGFTNKDGVCQADCKGNCENGYCAFEDYCVCKVGYAMNTTTNKCEPVCTGCTHGVCVAPDDCKCQEGYTKVENVCKPNCKNDCESGVCVSPNECLCNDGHSKNPVGNCKTMKCWTLTQYKQNCTIFYKG